MPIVCLQELLHTKSVMELRLNVTEAELLMLEWAIGAKQHYLYNEDPRRDLLRDTEDYRRLLAERGALSSLIAKVQLVTLGRVPGPTAVRVLNKGAK